MCATWVGLHQTLNFIILEYIMCCLYNALERVTIPSDGLLSGDAYKPRVYHEYVMDVIICGPIHICGMVVKMSK